MDVPMRPLLPAAVPPAAAQQAPVLLPALGSEAHRRVLRDSGLFMAGHYQQTHPGIAAAHIDPLRHYCDEGWRERRQANPYFDPGFYCTRTLGDLPDTDPLLHYALIGSRAGARPNAYFDPAWYRATHGDAEQDPLVRFAARDEALDLRPAAWFDTAWYRVRHRLSGTASPLLHFLARRHTARVSPLPEFDVEHYCRMRRDVAAHGADPFEHYLEHGWREGQDPSRHFESGFYVRRYLARQPEANPLLHYLAQRDGVARGAAAEATAPTLRIALHQELARASRAGVRRLSFPLYWHNGIPIHLEALRVFLSEPALRFGFQLAWGNEHLAARQGLPPGERALLQGYHRDDSDDADICALVAACFADSRHVRHHGRPVLALHVPGPRAAYPGLDTAAGTPGHGIALPGLPGTVPDPGTMVDDDLAPGLDATLARVCERWRRHLPDTVMYLTRHWLRH
jgi:hypothetical protein